VALAWIELIDAAATHEGTSQRPPSATAGLGYIQHSAAGCSRVGSLLLPAGGASVHEHADLCLLLSNPGSLVHDRAESAARPAITQARPDLELAPAWDDKHS
jgi:hypothetical protein